MPLQRDAGCGQPPTVTPLVSEGYLCPPGQEYDSLEWELAKWLIENKVSPFARILPVCCMLSCCPAVCCVLCAVLLSCSSAVGSIEG